MRSPQNAAVDAGGNAAVNIVGSLNIIRLTAPPKSPKIKHKRDGARRMTRGAQRNGHKRKIKGSRKPCLPNDI